MAIAYREDQARLEKLLRSVDRPGDFFAHGRSFYLMPRIAVAGVGVLSFPVPDTQVQVGVAGARCDAGFHHGLQGHQPAQFRTPLTAPDVRSHCARSASSCRRPSAVSA